MKDLLAGIGLVYLVKFFIDIIKVELDASGWLKKHPRKPWNRS